MGLIDRPFDPASEQWQRLIVRLGSRYYEKKPIQALAQAAEMPLDQILWDQEASLLWLDVLSVAWKQQRLRLLITAVSKDTAPDKIFVDLVNEPVDQDVVVVPPVVMAPGNGVGPAGGGPIAHVAPLGADASFATSVLWDDLPLIDRKDLRDSVRRMFGEGGRRTLLVQGGKGMGKTYTRQFVRYVSEQATAAGYRHKVSPVDASTRAGSPIDVRELAGVVAQYVVGTPPPTFDPTAQPQTIVTLFRTWLISEAETLDSEPVRWLIFDGFDCTTATSAANQLVSELAESAANRDLGPVRVIVLGFDDPLAQPEAALVEPLRHPSDDDLKAFFGGLGERLQGIRPTEDAIDVLFEDFTKAGGAIAGRQLCELGPTAFDYARDVFGPQS